MAFLFAQLSQQAMANSKTERMNKIFGQQTVRAEQQWVTKAPRPKSLMNVGIDFLRIFDPDWKREGNLPPIYLPENGEVFPLPVADLPPGDYDIFASNLAALESWKGVIFNESGELSVPFHPLQLERSPEVAELVDTHPGRTDLLFSPTSSTRSGFTFTETDTGVLLLDHGYIQKLSLPAYTSGANRSVGRGSLAKALVASKHIREAHLELDGKLAITKKKWTFFAEDLAIIRRGDNGTEGGRIYRKRDYNRKAYFYKPAYTLNVIMDDGRPYVRHLFDDSGYDDFDEFVIGELVLPHWELHLYLAFIEGHSPTTHGQNNGYLISKRNNRVAQNVMQDLSIPVSRAIRWINGRPHHIHLPDGLTPESIGVKDGDKAVLEGLQYIKNMFIDQVFSLMLDGKGLKKLRRRRLEVLQAFSQSHFDYSPSSFTDFRDFMRQKIKRATESGLVEITHQGLGFDNENITSYAEVKGQVRAYSGAHPTEIIAAAQALQTTDDSQPEGERLVELMDVTAQVVDTCHDRFISKSKKVGQ